MTPPWLYGSWTLSHAVFTKGVLAGFVQQLQARIQVVASRRMQSKQMAEKSQSYNDKQEEFVADHEDSGLEKAGGKTENHNQSMWG